jgi:16S rRNA (adenine1518-N6/adenine1519-N6)-dimethyltransferase
VLTVARLRAVLDAHGVHLTKGLGQHFLADPNTALKIARLAEIAAGDRVLEIGPGAGSLTVALVGAGASVTAVELDRHMVPVLEAIVAEEDATDRVAIVTGDALNVDLEALVAPGPAKCVSNLPYNVATPLLARLLEDVPSVRSMVLMVQREVAERWCAAPGSGLYGGISVKVAYYASAKIVGHVPPSVFLPPPKVDSALVHLVRHDAPAHAVDDPQAVFRLVQAGFAQRRKTLGRALRPVLGDGAPEVLEAAGIDPRARAETVPLAGWLALHDAVRRAQEENG